MEPRFLENLDLIEDDFDKNKDLILREMSENFDKIFKEAIKRQRENGKSKIRCISIFYLRSSIITGSLDFLVGVYDENYYGDFTPIYGQLYFNFIMKYYLEDIVYFEKTLREKIVRLQKYEVNEIKIPYAGEYFKVIEKFLENNYETIVELDSFKELDKDEELEITFGEFMDQNEVIYPDYLGMIADRLLEEEE